MLIEILILFAILGEIGWSIYDRLHNSAIELLNEIKTILEDSNAELADIADGAIEDEQSRS